MTVNVYTDNDTINAKIEGRLDSVTSSAFQTSIEKKLTDNIKAIVLDLEKVDFISSKALRVLVSLYKNVPDGNIKLVNPNKMVLEVIRLSGLTKVFKVESR